MLITIKRTGGFAGIPMTKVIDAATLPEHEANQLQTLLGAANFFHLPAQIPSTPQPDRFQYSISIEHDGKTHGVTVAETALPEKLKDLLHWLMGLAHEH